jgi:hypothetical protein
MTLTALLTLAFGVRAAETPNEFKVGEFTFKPPAGWDWLPVSSAMRKAQLRFPSGKTEQADVVFFHFGVGDGGGVQANIDRWLGQFREPKDKLNAKTEVATVNSRKVHFVQAEGTYLSGMPGGPRTPVPGTMLLGAILESTQGSVFIKCTGPASTVKDGHEAFRKMAEDALR